MRQQWIQEWENKVDEYNTDDTSVAHEVPDATVQHMRQHVERFVPPERQAGTFRGSRSEFLALEPSMHVVKETVTLDPQQGLIRTSVICGPQGEQICLVDAL